MDLKIAFDERALEILKSKDGNKASSKEDITKLANNFLNYNTLIANFIGKDDEPIQRGEHEVFFFYWYNKFIFCSKSNKCLNKNMSVAEALASTQVLEKFSK